jgi:hypothetical protein
VKKPKVRFEGDYVRGGAQTLYMTRSDVVETLAMIKAKYPGQLIGMLRESNQLIKEAHE